MNDYPITDGQRFALIKLTGLFGKGRDFRLWLIGEWLGKKCETTKDLSINDWRIIRNMAYPNWSDNDWWVSDDFRTKGEALYRQYEKEVLGQGVLFG